MSRAPVSYAGRALPTLNVDGTRRFLRPKLSTGRFWKRRVLVAWILIGIFSLLPYIRIAGKPAILLDVLHRRFTLFGTTFMATETVLLMLFLVGLFVGIFLLTALFGRVWCGWACPQTVYLEFLYRPLERWLERGSSGQRHLDQHGPNWRRLLRYLLFFVISAFLANTFLAYFVGIEQLRVWVLGSPLEHPAAFSIVLLTTVMMYLDFSWFREQTCAVACPYGRFQSVLLDKRSLIVGYDSGRGEPRGTSAARKAMPLAGDCIDCGACVTTCPTGIDIRDGLQMECIHCTQCIDACDAIMDKIGKPPGLVRYTSRAELSGSPRKFLRVRTVLYPLLIVGVWGALAVLLLTRSSADVWLLREQGSPYSIAPDGLVTNVVRLKIANRADSAHQYTISLDGPGGSKLVAPENPIAIEAGKLGTATFLVMAPPRSFHDGKRSITLHVKDGEGFERAIEHQLLGPEQEEEQDEHRR